MTKGWQKTVLPNGVYFCAQGSLKTIHSYVGDGSTDPTPKEIADYLDSHPDKFLDDCGKIFKEYDVRETKGFSEDLPAGNYRHQEGTHSSPEKLIPIELRKDTYIRMDSIYDPIVTEIKAFMDNEEIYRKTNTIYKRGILLYGPPGEGKTSMLRTIAINEFPADAVVIFFQTMPSHVLIDKIKDSLPGRLKIFIFEELANLLKEESMEFVLDFLDGEKSIDKSLIIATTNYPERLPGNIVERPSRFDRLIKMGHPKNKERKLLLGHYLMRDATDEEVLATNGLSTAAIKECCFLVHLNKITCTEAAKRLKDHSTLVKKDFAEIKEIGLGGGNSLSKYLDELF